MIRIKVFPLKKIIYKLEILIAYLFFLIIMIILIVVLFFRKQVSAEAVLSSNVALAYSKSNEGNIINKIVKSKIRILSEVDLDDLGEEVEQSEDYYHLDNVQNDNDDKLIVKLDESTTNNVVAGEDKTQKEQEILNVNIEEVKDWEKPKEYNTKLYDNGKVLVGGTLINNYSKLSLNLNELKKPSDFLIKQDTSFLIFHTHTSETYTIDSNKYSDFYRTEDENYNMVAVGKVLESELKNKGYYAMQDKTVHDYPSYNGAYKSSLQTVQKHLTSRKYDFVIDIHRDAISSNANFRPTTEINGESVARLMFVIGTNAAGLSHDKWMENLKLAIMIQNRANEMYPRII